MSFIKHFVEMEDDRTNIYVKCELLDVVCRNDDSRIRVSDKPQKVVLFCRFAFNLGKLSKAMNSIKSKLKYTALDHNIQDQAILRAKYAPAPMKQEIRRR